MKIRKLVLTGLFFALGIILPFFTGQIPKIGNMLLPMHIPVFLCGMLCGWQYGLIIGLILPFFRFALFGLPILYPTGISMSAELCVYGLLSGAIYSRLPKKISSVYISLISAMLGGRIIWALMQILLLGLDGKSFTWTMFIGAAFINASAGIAIQLVLIPLIIGINEKKVSE